MVRLPHESIVQAAMDSAKPGTPPVVVFFRWISRWKRDLGA
jgi:hypothetical protein